MKLRDLEKRLREEPENLGLRISYAGALREAGQHVEAVELYRSVAVAYRDQGRVHQAIACCRSILEIAPDDARCHTLLAALLAQTPRPAPDETPLPVPLPYHVADPTTSLHELSSPDLPAPGAAEPGEISGGIDRLSGIANAARRISASLIAAVDPGRALDDDDAAAELETRRRPRITAADVAKGSIPPAEAYAPSALDDDAVTLPPQVAAAVEVGLQRSRDTDDEMTLPRAMPAGTSQRAPSPAPALLASAFFAPLPRDRRTAVLTRFHRRAVGAGETVIRQGETGHALVVVVRGRLEVRAERADRKLVTLAVIGAGDYIGEAPLLSRVPSPTQVVATIASELLLLPPRDFYEIAGAFPALWAQLKDVAERRTREHEARLKR